MPTILLPTSLKAMSFMLRMMLRAFNTVEDTAENVDSASRPADPESDTPHREKARALKRSLVQITNGYAAKPAPEAAADVKAALSVARDLLYGIVSCASSDAGRAARAGPQWVHSLIQRALQD